MSFATLAGPIWAGLRSTSCVYVYLHATRGREKKHRMLYQWRQGSIPRSLRCCLCVIRRLAGVSPASRAGETPVSPGNHGLLPTTPSRWHDLGTCPATAGAVLPSLVKAATCVPRPRDASQRALCPIPWSPLGDQSCIWHRLCYSQIANAWPQR